VLTPTPWAAAAPKGKRVLLIVVVLVLVLRVVRKDHPEVTVFPTSPAATPAKKADSRKAQVKAIKKITAPVDKSKIQN
jgi:hypothetical protein